eukprot:9372070-Alexandrium_andersonii.AAC.1
MPLARSSRLVRAVWPGTGMCQTASRLLFRLARPPPAPPIRYLLDEGVSVSSVRGLDKVTAANWGAAFAPAAGQ